MSNSRSRQREAKKQGFNIPKKLIPVIAGGVLLIVAGIALLVILVGNISGGKPDLVVEQDFFDYGEVAFDTPIETVFVIRNEGNAPLKILGEPQVELREGC